MTRRPFRVALLAAVAFLGALEGYAVYRLWGNNAAPSIELEKTVIDFGNLPSDLVMTRQVQIRNRGNSNLVINKVQTGCGCSEASLSHNTVEPGQFTLLQISLRGDGSTTKAVTIYIFSNDLRQPISTLLATGSCITESFIEPKELDFGRIEKNVQFPITKTFKLFLKQTSGVGLNLSQLSAIPEESFVHIDSPTPADVNAKEFIVTLTKETPIGDIYSHIQLEDKSNSVSIRMSVCGYVVGNFIALPQMIMLGPIDPDDTSTSALVTVKRRSMNGAKSERGTVIDSIELSDSLKGLISATISSDQAVRISVTPKLYSGMWSSHQISGHIRIGCQGTDSFPETLNVPIGVTLRYPKIPDE